MTEYIDNYVDKCYSNYINKKIYIKNLNNNLLLCKFMNHESIIKINNNSTITGLLLRKPRSITVRLENNENIIYNKNEYSMVLSKELLDTYEKLMNENSIPNEIKIIINNYIPEYGKLF